MCRAPTLIFVDAAVRLRQARLAVMACAGSVTWALATGVAAVKLGTAAGSAALVAFGLDSLVDGCASGVLVWRFGAAGRSPARSARVEHIAVRLVGAALVISATYVAIQATEAVPSTRMACSVRPELGSPRPHCWACCFPTLWAGGGQTRQPPC